MAISVIAVSSVLGGGAGVVIRGWLNSLGYRREAEVEAPPPGRRGWVPAAAAVVSAVLAWRFVPSDTGPMEPEQVVVFAVLLVASWACLALAAIDLDVHRLPDRITGPTLVWLLLGLGIASFIGAGWAPWLRMLACAIGSGAFYLVLSLVSLTRGSSGLGLGDVKLSVVLGAALGWFGVQSLVVGVYAGFLIGGVWALALLVGRRVKLRGHLAFGPPMMVGALCGVLLPPHSVGSMF